MRNLKALAFAFGLLAFPAAAQTISGAGGVTNGTVRSVAAGAGLTGGPITDTGTLSASFLVNSQLGTTYTLQVPDSAKIVSAANASAQLYTLPASTAPGFTAGFSSQVVNTGVGAVSFTSASTFNPAVPVLAQGQSVVFTSLDSSNSYLVSDLSVPFMAADTVFGNFTASGAWPVAASMPACASDGTHAITYAAHAFACTTVSAGAGGGFPITLGSTSITANSTTTTLAGLTLTTPVIGAATGTSIALSGCTIGSDVFCLTGTATASGNISAAAFVPSGSTVPTNGMYLSGANTLNFSTASTLRATIASSGAWTIPGDMQSTNASGPKIGFSGSCNGTTPSLIPNRGSTVTGFGCQATGNISFIATSEIARVSTTGLLMVTGLMSLKSFTVSGLPAGITGGMAYVTDATVCTFATTVTGGGATFCPVIYNGTAYQAL